MVFLLVLGNRSQSDLPVQIFLLYYKLSEARNGHFGFFTLPRLRIRYKPIYLGTHAVSCFVINWDNYCK